MLLHSSPSDTATPEVARRHQTQAPEDADGSAVGQAAGEVLRKGRPGAQHAEGEGQHAPDVELARQGLGVAQGGEVAGIDDALGIHLVRKRGKGSFIL